MLFTVNVSSYVGYNRFEGVTNLDVIYGYTRASASNLQNCI